MKYTVEEIGEASPLFNGIKLLGSLNSKTLGFFPNGAYDEYAAKGGILAASTEDGKLAGYVLFRSVQKNFVVPKAVIVHLCVDEKYRGQNIAALLVSSLKERLEKSHLRIELSCRKDYSENSVWPKLGFKKIRERVGRSHDRKMLDMWSIDLQDLPLFKTLSAVHESGQVRAVLDANVLFRMQDDLTGKSGTVKALSEEAKALEMDWLSEGVIFLKTEETLKEISRNSDVPKTHRRKLFAQKFPTIESDRSSFEKVVLNLQSYMTGVTDNAVSDIRQLAHAVSGGAHFFITDDQKLLSKAKKISADLGLKVLTPGQFIGSIDESIREAEYHPAKLAASGISISKLRSDEVGGLFSMFRCVARDEKKNEFESRVRTFLSDPSSYDVFLLRKHSSDILGVWVYDRKNPNVLVVPMHRFSKSNLSATLKRYMIQRSISDAGFRGAEATQILDDCNDDEINQALVEQGFSQINLDWYKLNINFCGPASKLDEFFEVTTENRNLELKAEARRLLSEGISVGDKFSLVQLEKRFWPAKISDFDIPSYVIPILPEWAQELFDENLAAQTLFDSKEELILKNENVYYRSRKNAGGISSPARLLWYVTKANGYYGTMHIRACSYLDEVVIGNPKALFARFKRLGVYEWNNVSSITAGDLKKELMALRFSSTQLFSNPIDLELYRKILYDEDKKHPVLQSPQRISSTAFSRIYKLATGLALSER